MDISKMLEVLNELGLEITQAFENENKGFTIRASKTYNIKLGKRTIGCIVEFEFSLVANSDLNSLNRKIVDVKPLIPFLNEEGIDDLKTKAIQSLQGNTAFTITNFNIANSFGLCFY